MKTHLPQTPAVEPMVDGPCAAHALNLPLYYFTKPQTRQARRIPFYRIGRTIRFRLSELEAWSAQHREQAQAGEGA